MANSMNSGVQRREVELQNTYRRQVEEQQENDAKLAQELEEAGKSNIPTERQPSRNPFDTSSDTRYEIHQKHAYKILLI